MDSGDILQIDGSVLEGVGNGSFFIQIYEIFNPLVYFNTIHVPHFKIIHVIFFQLGWSNSENSLNFKLYSQKTNLYHQYTSWKKEQRTYVRIASPSISKPLIY